MAVRKFKPTTPGQRHKIIGTFEEITASVPEKSLVFGKRSTGGRNNVGKMTMRYMGGGHKRKYRLIDFKRNKDGVPAVVKTIEYDPNRSARIALLFYADGEKRYIIAPNGLQVGSTLVSGANAAPEIGNALPLENIPVGTVIHNIELRPGQGAALVRSAGPVWITRHWHAPPSCWAWTSIWKITTNSIWNRPNGLVFLIVEAAIQNAVPTVRDSPTRYTGKYTVLRFREIPKT